MQNPGSRNGPPMVDGPSQFWVVRRSVICWDQATNQKWSKWTKVDPHFTKTQWTFEISASVESSLHFHSKTFSAKPKESIGRQTDHLWEDLGSPVGFMGLIWPSTEDQIHNGAALHVAHPILSILFLLMPWGLKEHISKHGIDQRRWNIPSSVPVNYRYRRYKSI